MARFENIFLGLIGLAGIIASIVLAARSSGPCSGDGCMVRLQLIAAAIAFLISAPVFFISLRREMLRRKEKSSSH